MGGPTAGGGSTDSVGGPTAGGGPTYFVGGPTAGVLGDRLDRRSETGLTDFTICAQIWRSRDENLRFPVIPPTKSYQISRRSRSAHKQHIYWITISKTHQEFQIGARVSNLGKNTRTSEI